MKHDDNFSLYYSFQSWAERERERGRGRGCMWRNDDVIIQSCLNIKTLSRLISSTLFHKECVRALSQLVYQNSSGSLVFLLFTPGFLPPSSDRAYASLLYQKVILTFNLNVTLSWTLILLTKTLFWVMFVT